MCVAIENQGVVAWYVRLDGSKDPPVLDNNDEWEGDLSEIHWNMVSRTFTNFIFDMVSIGRFPAWRAQGRLIATDHLPGGETLRRLAERFREGPRTEAPDVRVFRFFTEHALLVIRSATSETIAAKRAEWTLDADTDEALFEAGRRIWDLGTLATTLQADSYRGEQTQWVLNALRAAGR